MLRLCRDNGIAHFEKDFSLTDVYGAEEAFVTGTFAGLVPVTEVDGRKIGPRGPMVQKLQGLYMELVKQESKKGPQV